MYEILTESGFKPFSGVKKSQSESLCSVHFDTGMIVTCTLNHRFKTPAGFQFAKCMKPGDKVTPRGAVVSVKLKIGSADVYDVVDVQGGHHYITNGVTSHNCVFMGSSDTLISGHKLQQLTFDAPIEVDEQELYKVYERPVEGHTYTVTVDVGEGIGKDYSVVSVFDITQQPYRHVAVYRNNIIPPLMLSDVIYKIAKKYNEAFVVIESNTVGKITADSLYHDFEYENMLTGAVKDSESVVSAGAGHVGIRTTRKTKAIGCSNLKTLIESDTLLTTDFMTVSELTTFIKKGTSFQAEENKTDDIVMTLVIFSWFASQSYFEDVTNVNMRASIKENFAKLEDQQHLVFGFYDDGTTQSDSESLFQ